MNIALVVVVKNTRNVMELEYKYPLLSHLFKEGRKHFFVFEGIDGSGKTTQMQLAKNWLESDNYQVEILKDPSDVSVSGKIRQLILDKTNNLDEKAELFLFLAAKSQLIYEQIEVALKEKKIILLDRFFLSTIAYQGFGRKMPLDFIIVSLSFLLQNCLPACHFLLDFSISDMRNRLKERDKGNLDRMEESSNLFFNDVREGYVSLYKNYTKQIKKIDALQDEQVIHHLIKDEMLFHL